MSRPLRIEFPGAVYHVTSRGDRREPIHRDDEDRSTQLDVIGLGLPAEPHDIAIALPVLQSPGIDDLFPFREKEMHAKLAAADHIRGLLHQPADDVTTGVPATLRYRGMI